MGVDEHRRKLRMVLEDGGFDRVSLEEILDLARRHGTLERTRRLAVGFSEEAIRCLEAFPDSTVRRALVDVAEFITSRTY